MTPILPPVFSVLAGLALGFSVQGNGPPVPKRQVPIDPAGVKTVTSPNGATIRYKEPGKEGICETTPGVNSYSGYVDLDDETHVFFYFFEARQNPNEAPLTLWLNGGPGSDSLVGLFEELGPCSITSNFTSELNPYSWNEVSNLLFLSQPVGVGFSYADEVVGILNATGFPEPSANPSGRWANVDPYKTATSALAAEVAWEVLQAFIQELPSLDPNASSRDFNLWTESYGGHYGPAFYRHFRDQNLAIEAGTAAGTPLNMRTLGIINGLISATVQYPSYPEYAYRNNYGLQTVNESIYDLMKLCYEFPGGCRDYLDYCASVDRSTLDGMSICAQAVAVCNSFVMSPFMVVSDRNFYDIRAVGNEGMPPTYWRTWLNQASTQDALGVKLNYTVTSVPVATGFDYTGDFAYPDFLEDLGTILDSGIKVALVYGDADYLCNWFGGEAVSLQVSYAHAEDFRSAGYAPFLVNGTEYGQTRQHGNFSFTRVYDSGHEVPFYQPKASLELFRRVLSDTVISNGTDHVPAACNGSGTANSTHKEP